MNIRLYKVLRWDREQEPCGFISGFEDGEVMSEKELREMWKRIIKEDHSIPAAEFFDYTKDNDYKKENWDDLENLSVGTIIDILNDLVNYDSMTGYYILETDVEL